MRKTNRLLTLLALALPVALSACSLPLAPFTMEPSRQAAHEQRGSLTIRWTGLSLQSLAEVAHLDLSIRVPAANYVFNKRILASELTAATELTLDDLPVGLGEIEAKAFKVDASLLKAKRSSIRIVPGVTTHAEFDFYLGGNSATDLELSFQTRYPQHFASLEPYDPDFNDFWAWGDPSRHLVWRYVLSGSTFPSQEIEYHRDLQGGFWRSVDGGEWSYVEASSPESLFLNVPAHTVLIGDGPKLNYPKVRHLRFDNVFPTAQGDKELTVERYYAPHIGLVKEVVFDGETILSEMTLQHFSNDFEHQY